MIIEQNGQTIITNEKIEKLKQKIIDDKIAKEIAAKEAKARRIIRNRKERLNTRLKKKRKKARRKKEVEKQKLETIERNRIKKEKLKASKPIKKPLSWRILLTSQKRKLTEVCYASNMEDALFKFNKILEENKKDVRFPIKVSSRDHIQIPTKYELLLMKRNFDESTNETFLKNEIGQFTPNKPNTDKWLIFQKSDFLFEETFWVYGFNPKVQRKTFDYILNKILLINTYKTKIPLKRVMVFKNKLIIESDDDFDIVICKNVDDCIRLYNELEFEVTNLKLKCVYFSGFTGEAIKKRLVEKIKEKTGWDNKKIGRASTRP
jgi:hypothetical protein